MKLVKEGIQVSSAHLLSFHRGKCAFLHGHNWNIGVEIMLLEGELLDGMVLDFGDIKKIFERYDHKFLLIKGKVSNLSNVELGAEDVQFSHLGRNWQIPAETTVLLDVEPTAENLAEIFVLDLTKIIQSRYQEARISSKFAVKVTVEETPGSKAEATGMVNSY